MNITKNGDNIENTNIKEEIKVIPTEEIKELPKEEIKEIPKEEIKEIPKEEIKEPISGEYDTLVLSGGSIQAIITLGALQYATDNFLLNHINTYIGTSAGAIIGYLLSIGYTPIEIMIYLCTKQILEKIKNFNVVAMMNGSGATSYVYLHEQLERMTIEKIGKLITLKDLYDNYGKKLICVTHNLTINKIEYLSHETYPDLPCLIALRMSSNLPFIFDHFKYLGSFYIDGGISNNFPINKGEEEGKKILGIVITKMSDNFSKDPGKNMIEYIYQLMSIQIECNTVNMIDNSSDKSTIIPLKPDATFFFNFNLDSHSKLEMFSHGYTQMKEYWEKN